MDRRGRLSLLCDTDFVCKQYYLLPSLFGEEVRVRRLLQSKRAFPCHEEGVSSHRRDAFFVYKQCYSLPSPFGEGAGVRHLLPLSVRSGEALNDHYLTSQESPPRSELTSSRMAQQ